MLSKLGWTSFINKYDAGPDAECLHGAPQLRKLPPSSFLPILRSCRCMADPPAASAGASRGQVAGKRWEAQLVN